MLSDGRILIIRLGSLGDVVFTLPAVEALRAAYPQARFSFLVYKEFAPVLQGFGQLESVLVLDRAGYRRLNPRALLGSTVALLWALRRRKFRLTIDFQGFGETGWLSWWTGAPERWGSVYRPKRKWAYTRPVIRDTALHPIEYDLDLIRQAGGLTPVAQLNGFEVPPWALEEARRMLTAAGLVAERPTLLIHSFTSSSEKNWPLEKYLTLAQRAREQGVQVVFCGGPADCAALEPAMKAGFTVTAGAPLLVSAGLARLATLVVGGDTGLLHLAVTMGRPVVMLMRFLGPGTCYPYGHQEWAVVPAHSMAIADIAVEAVWQRCEAVLAQLR